MGEPVLLAFDTATEYCSVALAYKAQVYCRTEKLGNSHSECLLPWIDELIKNAGISLKDLNGILFSSGPGSFTGLRIACGVAQGLAYGLDKKLLPTSTLTALGYHYRDRGKRIAVLNDARMNECYAAIYENSDGRFKVLQPERLVKPEEVQRWLEQNEVTFVVGTAIGVYDMNLKVEHLYAHPDASYMIEWFNGCRDTADQLWVDPDKAAPMYIRDHVALTINERLQGAKL